MIMILTRSYMLKNIKQILNFHFKTDLLAHFPLHSTDNRFSQINFATRRARVRWDEQQIKLSDILAAIVAIVIALYRLKSSVNLDEASEMRG